MDIILLKYPFNAAITKIQEANIPIDDHKIKVFRPHLSIMSSATYVAITFIPPIRVVATRGLSITPSKNMPE
jgi:hypothetical protein